MLARGIVFSIAGGILLTAWIVTYLRGFSMALFYPLVGFGLLCFGIWFLRNR